MRSYVKMVANALTCVALSAMTVGLVVHADDEEIGTVYAKCVTKVTNNQNEGCKNAGAQCKSDGLCGIDTTDNSCACDP